MNPFENALEILKTDGWCQGAMENEQGQHCIYGLLAKSLFGDGSTDNFNAIGASEEMSWVREQVKAQWGRECGAAILLWNDSLDRKVEDIERVLEKCAVQYEEGIRA